ncbi:MAG: hypothetical protein HY043_20935 [Verrucomicrobia bacterium]|nr:hypothetical protein [Verrucomicrobiota bacterium]
MKMTSFFSRFGWLRSGGKLLTLAGLVAVGLWSVNASFGQTPLVTSTTLGGVRNNLSGWVGIRIDVQSAPITVTALGRLVLRGNTQTHSLKLVVANTGVDVPGTTVTVATARSTAGQYKYATLATPVVLSAGTSYYLVSSEVSGRDYCAISDGSSIVTTSVATVPGTVLSAGSGWSFRAGANMTRGVNLLYNSANVPPTINISSPIGGAKFIAPANISIDAVAADSDGTLAQVQILSGATVLTTLTAPPNVNSWNPSFSWNAVPVGNYSLTARATDNNAATTTSVPVTISVAANLPPAVAILTPASGNIVNAPATITLTANAADSDGTVARVNYIGAANNLLGTSSTSPYSVTLNNLAAGTFVVTAQAVDNLGAVGISGPVTLIVNAPPTANVLTPAVGTILVAPASLTLTASAADIDGTVLQVNYFDAANALIGSSTISPYPVSFINLASGAYTFTAQAVDDNGAIGFSAPVTITVQPPANVPPTVSILTPADGVSLLEPASITLTAAATDADGTVTNVDYFDSHNTLVGSATANPYSVTLNGLLAGTYLFTAQATDNGGALGASAPVHVVVSPPNALAPANDSFYAPQIIAGATGSAVGSNVGATSEPGEPFHAGNIGGSSIWYQWTAPSSTPTSFDTVGSGFNTLLAIYDGTGVSSLTSVAANDDISPLILQSEADFFPAAGTTYQIAVDGFNGVAGSVVLNWYPTPQPPPPPPSNDAFASAQVLPSGSGSVTGSNVSATKEPGEPNHAGDAGGHSVWFQWTSTADATATLDTFGSGFDTLLAVYTGTSVSGVTPVASNNDVSTGTIQSWLTFTAQAGVTYMFAIDGAAGAFGSYSLNLQLGPPPLPDLTIWAHTAQVSWYLTNETFTSTQCDVVEGLVAAGSRRLLRFSSETRNIGTADWYVGNPVGNPLFVWAPCHAHYHMAGFMQYLLLDQNGQMVAPGKKIGFCLSDSLRWDSNAGTRPKYHCLIQGIQKGWADVYSQHTSGQWIDITGLPDGYYTLEATVNPNHIFLESDYSNNTITVPIVIGTPAPPNDNLANATVLSGTSGTVNQTTAFATKEPGEPNHAGNAGGRSVWFSWTAASTDAIIIDTLFSKINTLLAVYTGSSVNALTLVASNDDIPGAVPSTVSGRVIINPVVGTTYWIAVDGYNGASGNIKLNWLQTPPPANDMFANAQVLSGTSGTVKGMNFLATKEPGEPNHAGNTGGKSLWFQWTATSSGTNTVDTLGSDFDTSLAVYTGNAVNALTLVAQNEDMGGPSPYNVLSQVSFDPVVGITYWIAVDGYRGKSGRVQLNWNQMTLGGSLSSLHRNPGSLALAKVHDQRPQLTCSPEPGGGFLLKIEGVPDQYYDLQSSPDLHQWTRVHTVQADANGLALMVDRSKPAGRVSLSDPVCGAESGLNPALARALTPRLFYRVVAMQDENAADLSSGQ